MERSTIVTPPKDPSPATSEESGRLPPADPPRPQSSQRPVASSPGQSSPQSAEIQQLLEIVLSPNSPEVSRTKARESLISQGEKGTQALLEVATNKNLPLLPRHASLEALSSFSGETSDAHIKSIGSIAADPSEAGYIVAATLKTLGSLKDIRAARELAQLAARGDPIGHVALLKLSESPADLLGIAPQLTALYQTSTPQARSVLLPRLAELKDRPSIQLVSEALLNPHLSPRTKESIIEKVSSPEYAQEGHLPALGKLLSSSSTSELRLQALEAITLIALQYGLEGNHPSISPLRNIADTPHDPLQPDAAVNLALLEGDEQALVKFGRSPHFNYALRITALEGLIDPSASVLPSLRELAQDPTVPDEVRIAAASALGRSSSGGPDQGNIIKKMLGEAISPQARLEGLRALLNESPTEGVKQVKDAFVRRTIPPKTAATLLTEQTTSLPSSITTPVLLELLKKLPPNSQSTGQVIEALGNSKEPSVISSLQALQRVTKQGSPNADHLLAALVRLGDKNAVDQMLSRLTWTAEDSDFLHSLAVSPHPPAAAALASQLQTDTPSEDWRSRAVEDLPPPEKVAFGERLIAAAETERDPQKSLFLKSYGEAIVTATTKLGIKSPFRYPPEFLISAVRERLSPTLDGRPLATVITAREDYNLAFNGRWEHFTALHQAGYRVMLYEVATDKQAVLALQMAAAQGQKADLIMFYGHGSQRSLAFGAPDPRLSRSDGSTSNDPGELTVADEVLLRGASYTLRPGGEIIAVSCSLGEGGRGADNMASFFRRVFPQAKRDGIYTLTGASVWENIKFTPSGTHVRSSVDVLQSTRPTSSDEKRTA